MLTLSYLYLAIASGAAVYSFGGFTVEHKLLFQGIFFASLVGFVACVAVNGRKDPTPFDRLLKKQP